MMLDTNLFKTLWPFAVETVIHVLNCLIQDSEIELAKIQNQIPKPSAQLWREDLSLLNPEVSIQHLCV